MPRRSTIAQMPRRSLLSRSFDAKIRQISILPTTKDDILSKNFNLSQYFDTKQAYFIAILSSIDTFLQQISLTHYSSATLCHAATCIATIGTLISVHAPRYAH